MLPRMVYSTTHGYVTRARFLDAGEWPAVGELQRHFDQRGIEVSVVDVIASKPRVLNEARLIHGDQLNLQL